AESFPPPQGTALPCGRAATPFGRVSDGTILVCGHLLAMQTGREFASPFGHRVIASLIGATIYFATTAAFADGLLKFSGSQLEPMKWGELAGWTADDHLAAFAAYQTSCRAMLKLRRGDERGELSGALSNVCRRAVDLQPQN